MNLRIRLLPLLFLAAVTVCLSGPLMAQNQSTLSDLQKQVVGDRVDRRDPVMMATGSRYLIGVDDKVALQSATNNRFKMWNGAYIALPVGGGTLVTTPTTLTWRFTGTTYHLDLVATQPTVGHATITIPDLASVSDTMALLTKAQTFVGAKTFTAVITPTGGLAAAGGFTTSPRSWNTGQHAATSSSDGNDSTPSTTETYCSEIFVPCNATITGVALFNGSDVTGNVTVGLADSTGAPITAAKSASTAGSGTDAYQRIPLAVAYAAKGPATYYIQVQYSSATARYNTHTVGNHGVQKQTSQTYGTFASFTPSGTFVTNIGNIAGLY